MKEFKSLYTGKILNLLCCPFCGTYPQVMHIGNEYTKSRKITIKCKSCRIQRTDAALTHGFEWLEGVAEKNWNQRPAAAEIGRAMT